MRAAVFLLLLACSKSSTPQVGSGAAPTQPESTTVDKVDLSGYSKTCTTAADCILVHAWPCDHCGCAREPIAKSERDRYNNDAAKVDCDKHRDKRVCGECREYTATCDNGVCGAKQ